MKNTKVNLMTLPPLNFIDEPLEWVCWPGIIVSRYFNTKIRSMPHINVYTQKNGNTILIGYATFHIKKLWWVNQNRNVPHFCLYLHKKTVWGHRILMSDLYNCYAIYNDDMTSIILENYATSYRWDQPKTIMYQLAGKLE
jgi:hypothetical protein